MLALLHPLSASSSLTCNDVKSFYQGKDCCDGSGIAPIQTDCPAELTPLERKCHELGNHLSGWGNVHQTKISKRPSGFSYCLLGGALQDDVPWTMALPLDTGAYSGRLIGRGGYAYDTGDGQLGIEDFQVMETYNATMVHMAIHGNTRNRFVSALSTKGDDHGEYLKQAGLVSQSEGRSDHDDIWFGGGWHSMKRLANSLIEEMYGSKPTYSYMHGCSGAGRNAIQNGLLDPSEWSGIAAMDFFEPVIGVVKGARYVTPFYKGDLPASAYTLNVKLREFYCDSDSYGDGVKDTNAHWECDYNPNQFECGVKADAMKESIREYAEWVATNVNDTTCFSASETGIFGEMYTNGLRLMDGKKMWRMDDQQQELLGVLPMLDKTIAKGKSFVTWKEFQRAAFMLVIGSTDHHPEIAKRIRDIATIEADKFAAGQSYDENKAVVDVFYGNDTKAFGDFFEARAKMSVITHTPKTHFETFRKAGGKMILVTHTGDELSTPENGKLVWHNAWKALTGGTDRTAIDSFLRYYPIPSSGHCGSKEGELVYSRTSLDDVIKWVEEDTPPPVTNYTITTSMSKLNGGFIYEDAGFTYDTGVPMCPFPDTIRTINGTATCVCLHNSSWGSYCTTLPAVSSTPSYRINAVGHAYIDYVLPAATAEQRAAFKTTHPVGSFVPTSEMASILALDSPYFSYWFDTLGTMAPVLRVIVDSDDSLPSPPSPPPSPSSPPQLSAFDALGEIFSSMPPPGGGVECSGSNGRVTVKLYDSYGDGWNAGSSLQVSASAQATAQYLLPKGGGAAKTFCTTAVGDCVEFRYKGDGSWHTENSASVEVDGYKHDISFEAIGDTMTGYYEFSVNADGVGCGKPTVCKLLADALNNPTVYTDCPGV